MVTLLLSIEHLPIMVIYQYTQNNTKGDIAKIVHTRIDAGIAYTKQKEKEETIYI